MSEKMGCRAKACGEVVPVGRLGRLEICKKHIVMVPRSLLKSIGNPGLKPKAFARLQAEAVVIIAKKEGRTIDLPKVEEGKVA